MSACLRHLLGVISGGGISKIKGWTDGVNCTGSNEIIVSFPKDVSFSDQTNISVYTLNGKTLNIPLTPTKPAANQINYGGDWSVPLDANDIVYWEALVGNTYIVGSTPLDASQITLRNCLVYIPTGNEVQSLAYLGTIDNFSLDLNRTIQAPLNSANVEFNTTRF